VTERWVCKRCFADNDETNAACERCGLTRGAEATDADQAGWAAAQPGAQPQAGGGWTPWLRFWWIPAIVIALAVGYFTQARRGDDGGITDGGTLQIQDLRVGDCFVFEDTADEISEVDARPCGQPHRYEMFHIATWNAGGDYPTEDAWFAFFIDACVPQFESYVGHDYQASQLDFVPFTPTEQGWDAGDRVVQCALVDPSEAELTESLRNANR
jgi:hypothetical protein